MAAAKNLFTTIAEMQPFFPFDGNMEFWELKSDLSLVEQKYLVDEVLGFATWSALMTYMGEDGNFPAGGNWEQLLEICRHPAAKLTALYKLPEANVKYTGAGLLVTRSEKSAPASEFRTKDLKLNLMHKAQEHLGLLVRFLEGNTAIFVDWAASEERADRSKIFPDARSFSKYYNISENHWIFRKLQSFISDVEDTHLTELLGAAYLSELRSQLADGSLTEDNKPVVKIIRQFVANMAMVEAIPRLSIDISPRGIILFHNERGNADENFVAADPNRIELMVNKALSQARAKKSDLSNFLNTNATTVKYAAYKSGPAYLDPSIDINDFGNDPDDPNRAGYYTG